MMFNEMKITALLHKYKNADATVFPAWKVLRMATIEAAQALGMEKSIGSLRAGKLADIIIVNLQVPHLTPILEVPVRNIVPKEPLNKSPSFSAERENRRLPLGSSDSVGK